MVEGNPPFLESSSDGMLTCVGTRQYSMRMLLEGESSRFERDFFASFEDVVSHFFNLSIFMTNLMQYFGGGVS